MTESNKTTARKSLFSLERREDINDLLELIREKEKRDERRKDFYILKRKKDKKNLLVLNRNILKPKKYCDSGYIEYKGKRDVRNLLKFIDKHYYKPIRTGNAFSSNYS